MDLIIDGYNLLALDRRLDRRLEQSRNSLIKQLAHYHAAKPLNLTVVFDGWRSGSPNETRVAQDGISIVYSRLGEKADAVVIRLARERGSGAVVVSSDREIRTAVERFGVVALHAQEFHEILQDLDFREGQSGFEDQFARPSGQTSSKRVSKADRNRQDKLRKLRL